jgi:uncharacterized oligopeptide transporter (OPT) family protein
MVGKVRRSVYREPITADGLRKIEEGSLEWFDTEMFANFNTGVLEQYLDEKNRTEAFKLAAWDWKKIAIAIVVGALFALVNQYVGLKVGMVIAGSWYIMFLLGLAFKWNPAEINVSSTASNGAAMICTGFVFTFPAIYLLAVGGFLGEEYRVWDPAIGDAGAFVPVIPNAIIAIALVATILSGILGTMYFIIFRRIWLVEDPLPVPGFEATVKLLDLSHTVGKGGSEEAKRSVRLATIWIGGVAFFTFIKDFPLIEKISDAGRKYSVSIMDHLFGSEYYHQGDIMQPLQEAKYSHFVFTLIPMQFGLGWFMKFRVAFLIFLGTAFTWFIVVPLAVAMDVPYYYAEADKMISINQCWGILNPDIINLPITPAYAAYDIARVMAIGCILGGGFTALIKMAPIFKTVTSDMLKASKGGDGEESEGENRKGSGGVGKEIFIPYKGWYEWPASHIKVMLIVTLIGVAAVFIIGGFPVIQSIIFSILLVGTTFFLGAIAVKVMGETGTEPVSATSFMVLLMLVATFVGLDAIGLHMSKGMILIMALVGTTVFGGAISMSGDIILNFKNGIYCGNRPYHLVRALTPGIIPGTIIAAISGAILSIGLSTGVLNLVAPQAHAFELFAKILMVGQVDLYVFLLGIILGIFMELLIGMGTAFGLGMYLPLGIQIPMLLGGAGRDLWEKKIIEPKAKAENWSERRRTLKLLDSYMMATGMIVGEAIMGTLIAIYLVFPLISGGT